METGDGYKDLIWAESGLPRAQFDRLWDGAFVNEDYVAYTKCSVWHKKRIACAIVAKWRCERCRVDIRKLPWIGHHCTRESYRRLFRERIGVDVMVVCRGCNRFLHARLGLKWRLEDLEDHASLFTQREIEQCRRTMKGQRKKK